MTITIITDNSQYITDINPGDSLLDAINKAGAGSFDAPCGGKGTCGKCRVKVLSGAPAPDEVEIKFLSEDELASGVRLACRIFPVNSMEIAVTSSGEKAIIQSGFNGEFGRAVIEDESVYKRVYAEFPPPSIHDQRSDLQRLREILGRNLPSGKPDISIPVLRKLPAILRENDFKVTGALFSDKLTALYGGNRTADYYAVAVDIGTTTVVAYLVRLSGSERGTVVDHISGLNSQKGYGGDVISRIEYCMQGPGNLDNLHRRITTQISGFVDRLAERNNISVENIGLVTVAGNTTMNHLFSGLDPEGIAAAPFIPVDTGLYLAPAVDFDLDIHSGCACAVLPGIASYVGADITAGIVATGMHEADELCLLIDIGTNGEIVLGNKDGMTACSTAAGPALEGANISCGMGGIPGAINSLSAIKSGDREIFRFSVIDDIEPAGICGSGIIDAVALFIEAGLIDETGRILSVNELEQGGISESWINCIHESAEGPEIKITENISITQKDIREIQMAKAAISAGVKTLLSEAGKTTADVGRLYIAGGFGAAMNKKSAAVTGLFPAELEKVVEIAGNTAGKGAVLAALSGQAMNRMSLIAEEVNYIELSTSALFQQEYMMAMYF